LPYSSAGTAALRPDASRARRTRPRNRRASMPPLGGRLEIRLGPAPLGQIPCKIALVPKPG
jgi:hypothetical protein